MGYRYYKGLIQSERSATYFKHKYRGENESDKLYWNEDLSGEYTVKSAYKLLQLQKGQWHSSDNSSLWKLLWRVKAPPKSINMVWRALSQCLPTKTILHAKRVPINLLCPVCDGAEESIVHALVSCPFADQCWRRRGGMYLNCQGLNFNEWLQRMFDRTGREEQGEIVNLCWTIYTTRKSRIDIAP